MIRSTNFFLFYFSSFHSNEKRVSLKRTNSCNSHGFLWNISSAQCGVSRTASMDGWHAFSMPVTICCCCWRSIAASRSFGQLDAERCSQTSKLPAQNKPLFQCEIHIRIVHTQMDKGVHLHLLCADGAGIADPELASLVPAIRLRRNVWAQRGAVT